MRAELIGYLADSYINSIASKKIHVLASHHTEYALSENLVSNTLVMAKEDPDFSRMAVLAYDGDFYSLKVNASFVCVEDYTLVKCKDPTLFGLSESKYGYKLTYYDKCLTISSNKLVFKDCNEDNKNQDLVFEDKSAFYCKEDQISSESEPGMEPGHSNKKAPSQSKLDKKLKKGFEKHGIKDKNMQNTLKKMWKWKFGFWSWFNLCNI